MHRLVLACLLMLLPLQWSAAAAAWYGSHLEAPPASELAAADDESVASGHIAALAATDQHGSTEADHACTPDCHLDDPLCIGIALARLALLHGGPPTFEYTAPTSSHIPAGPERPDRPPAA